MSAEPIVNPRLDRQPEVPEALPWAEYIPKSVTELEDATDGALAAVDNDLGLWMTMEEHYRGQKMRRGTAAQDLGELVATPSYEAWLDLTNQLEDQFGDETAGLSQRVLELISLSDQDFIQSGIEPSMEMLELTAPIAERMYPLIDHIARLRPGGTRTNVLKSLFSASVGERTVQGETQQRFTLVGALHVLAGRVIRAAQAHEAEIPAAATAWILEEPIQVSQKIHFLDPFAATPDNFLYWSPRVQAEMPYRQELPSIFELSRQRTAILIGDLNHLAFDIEGGPGPLANEDLRAACRAVCDWLERKMVYYNEGDPAALEHYNLTWETPDTIGVLFQALDTIKRYQPALCVEMMGVNTSPIGHAHSMYYGTFLHKALANTTRLLEGVSSSHASVLDRFRLGRMIDDLRTADKRIRTFSGRISEQRFTHMLRRGGQYLQQLPPHHQGMVGAIAQVMLVPVAADVGVHKELTEMRQAAQEDYVGELRGFLEHLAQKPLLLLEYIGGLPRYALRDPAITQLLRPLFKELCDEPEQLQAACRERRPEVVTPLFNEIELVGEGGNMELMASVVRSLRSIAPLGSNVITQARVAGDRVRFTTPKQKRAVASFLEAVFKERAVYPNFPQFWDQGDEGDQTHRWLNYFFSEELQKAVPAEATLISQAAERKSALFDEDGLPKRKQAKSEPEIIPSTRSLISTPYVRNMVFALIDDRPVSWVGGYEVLEKDVPFVRALALTVETHDFKTGTDFMEEWKPKAVKLRDVELQKWARQAAATDASKVIDIILQKFPNGLAMIEQVFEPLAQALPREQRIQVCSTLLERLPTDPAFTLSVMAESSLAQIGEPSAQFRRHLEESCAPADVIKALDRNGDKVVAEFGLNLLRTEKKDTEQGKIIIKLAEYSEGRELLLMQAAEVARLVQSESVVYGTIHEMVAKHGDELIERLGVQPEQDTAAKRAAEIADPQERAQFIATVLAYLYTEPPLRPAMPTQFGEPPMRYSDAMLPLLRTVHPELVVQAMLRLPGGTFELEQQFEALFSLIPQEYRDATVRHIIATAKGPDLVEMVISGSAMSSKSYPDIIPADEKDKNNVIRRLILRNGEAVIALMGEKCLKSGDWKTARGILGYYRRGVKLLFKERERIFQRVQPSVKPMVESQEISRIFEAARSHDAYRKVIAEVYIEDGDKLLDWLLSRASSAPIVIEHLLEMVEHKGMADTILYFEDRREQYAAQGRDEYYKTNVIEAMVDWYNSQSKADDATLYSESVKTDLTAVVEYFERKYVRTKVG